MLNEVYDTVETILESLDTGGEQTLRFAEEIKMLKDLLSYPEPASDELELTLRRCEISRKLERLAVQADGLIVSLPTLPVAQWLDGTFEKPDVEVSFEKCDLARLLQFLADYGVGHDG
jgi:hypothetical protein